VNPYDNYRQVATQTADPVELVVMLYRGAINFLGAAERAIHAGQAPAAHQGLMRSQAIVAELMGTLNLDAGEVATDLRRLYDYMQQRLIEANLRKDQEPVAEVRGMLIDLLGAWEELARTQRVLPVPPRAYAATIAVA
jgi:flagellar secretion chaperone FliS